MNNLLAFGLVVFGLSLPPASAKQNDFGVRLDKVIASSGLSRSDLGLAVATVNGEVLYQLNADRKMSPASLSKIPTAIAALENLSPNYEFTTQIWSSGKIEDGTLNGNLYLKGMGEPELISERLWFLVNAFMRNEVKTITGDLIVDESFFDAIRADKDRLAPSEGRAFDAPVSALSFNWNSVNVFIRPGKKAGDAPKIFVDPVNEYIVEVINNVKTTAHGEAAIEVKPTPVLKNGEVVGDKLVVSGTIPEGSKEIVKYRSISEPDMWTGINFREFLKQRGIVVNGRVKKGHVPDSATLLVGDAGDNARQAVIDMLKFSNNFIAEMLTKTLAVNAGASQGNMEQGLQVIYKQMEKAGIPAPSTALLLRPGFPK